MLLCFMLLLFFFFKQKTAYEMRISDWSSDVCSSDLDALALGVPPPPPMPADAPSPAGLPEWRVAQAAVKAAEGDVLVASRNRRPDPTVGVSGGRIDYGNVQDRIIGVSVRIPLFVRNSFRAEVVAAKAEAAAAVADAARLRLELAAEQQAAIDSYRAKIGRAPV